MSALSDLTAEVRFRERMRGYDYDEVDDFVKAVNQAAAQALERIAELQERVRQLESSQTGDEDVGDTRETLLRTLVLAQRTADAAVAEARSEAAAITDAARERATKTVSEADAAATSRLRSAEEQATRVLAEGEENCRLIIAETKRTAAAEMSIQRERAIEELRALQAAKAEVETESARISARLEYERTKMQELMASFRAFVEEINARPAAGRSETQMPIPEVGQQAATAPPPAPAAADEAAAEAGHSEVAAAPIPQTAKAAHFEVAAAPIPQAAEAAEAEAVEPSEIAGSEEAAPIEGHADEIAESISSDDGGESPSESDSPGDDAEGDDSVGATSPVDEPAVQPYEPDQPTEAHFEPFDAAEPVPDVPVVRWLEDTGSVDQVRGQLPLDVGGPEPAEDLGARGFGHEASADPSVELTSGITQSWPVVGSDAPGLFDADADEDDEFIEQLRRVVSSDAPLPNHDAAMSAFFDHDESEIGGGRQGGLTGHTDGTNWVGRFGRRP